MSGSIASDGSDQPTRHSIGQLAFPKAVSRAFTAAIAIPRTMGNGRLDRKFVRPCKIM
jgi:hypothetical protein